MTSRDARCGRVSLRIFTTFALAVAPLVIGCTSSAARRFQAHVDYLASDQLAGRGVGTEGIELAADYIAAQFRDAGLEPGAGDGTFFQSFPIALRRTLTDESSLKLVGDERERKLHRDFVPFIFSSGASFKGGVVFCGYGIEAADKNHNDYEKIDLNGKVALMLRGEPPSWSEANGEPTRYAMFRDKVYDAKDRGAVAVLITNQAPTAPAQPDTLIDFDNARRENYGIPAFHISRSFARAMLHKGGLGSLKELQRRLDAAEIVSAPLGHVAVSGNPGLRQQTAPTRNVIGLLRGRGPLADECVVLGAHYDHLGIRKPMMRRFKAGKLIREDLPPQIHNGADDNASGVAGLIEIARRAAAAPPPRRSLLFVAFSAEESGLLGSAYYVKHPVFSLENTVAMLNMDMIGRMNRRTDRVLVFGAKSGTGIEESLMRRAAALGLEIAPSKDSGGRSDHASFIRKKIPALHFLTGIHSDYHKPSDDADKINARGGVEVERLVYDIAEDIANAHARPKFQAVNVERKEAKGASGTPTYRVVMGLAPGYAEGDQPGMAVEAVTPEGPADVAGMKGGDRIVRINDKDVGNIYDYMAAMRKNKPGDHVTVVVMRNGKKLVLDVTLAPAR